jgi:hypothetical protein
MMVLAYLLFDNFMPEREMFLYGTQILRMADFPYLKRILPEKVW